MRFVLNTGHSVVMAVRISAIHSRGTLSGPRW